MSVTDIVKKLLGHESQQDQGVRETSEEAFRADMLTRRQDIERRLQMLTDEAEMYAARRVE